MPGKVIQSGSVIAPNRSLSEILYAAPLPFIVATKGRGGGSYRICNMIGLLLAGSVCSRRAFTSFAAIAPP